MSQPHLALRHPHPQSLAKPNRRGHRCVHRVMTPSLTRTPRLTDPARGDLVLNHVSIILLTPWTSEPRPNRWRLPLFYLSWQSNSHSSMHLSGRNWPQGQHWSIVLLLFTLYFCCTHPRILPWVLREAHAHTFCGPNTRLHIISASF